MTEFVQGEISLPALYKILATPSKISQYRMLGVFHINGTQSVFFSNALQYKYHLSCNCICELLSCLHSMQMYYKGIQLTQSTQAHQL